MGRFLIIAHRGASGYLPEHTLASASFAYALGADYIEQDVVLSRDGVLVVTHDIHLDTTTDVATRYPGRARADGRFYALDFTWAELQQLQVRERFDPVTGRPVFPHRFPSGPGPFGLCTMEEQLQLIQGLNASTGRTVGVYPEIKAPAWHARQGSDPGRALLALLDRYGYRTAQDSAIVQCFEPAELQRLRREGCRLTFVQLVEAPGAAEHPPEALLSPAGLHEVATYAQGIGPHYRCLLDPARRPPAVTSVTRDAHAAGLFVHAYTLRADDLPSGMPDLPAFVALLRAHTGIDGIFVDHPDQVGSA